MIFRKTWITPAGTQYRLCMDMLQQPHLLIAGCTGSGKSVLINSLVYHILYALPYRRRLILIDPKRVELAAYKRLPHTVYYGSEPGQILQGLALAESIMEERYKQLQRRGQKQYDGGEIYVIIDEYADLMTTQKRETLPIIIRLAQLGRAAGVHLILATQRPTRDIIDGRIKVNLDSRVALRCPTAQDSKNIINVKGAELLPRYGYGYYLTPAGLELREIPYTPENALQERVQWWHDQTGARAVKRRLRGIFSP